ncbi:hypothetical protein GGS24DRAFT_509988 [Hypoxylon argillaceum]|nr:hypothetical protein GGS24DRAFT_509988 [Hypoxylon argillaceum]
MLLLNTLFLTLFWVMTPVSCLPDTTVSHYASTKVQALANLTWEGSLTEDGPNVSFTGQSMAEIRSQINEVAPGFVWPEPVAQLSRSTARQSMKRSQHRMLCDQATDAYADYHQILDQAAQLQAMPGFCRVSPTLSGMPLSCTRLTCASGSAISLCNQSDSHDSISTCARVGQYAEEIIEWCYDGTTSDVKGQIYDGDLWFVMVHADDCV